MTGKRICGKAQKPTGKQVHPTRVLVVGFLLMIVFGACLLSLPVSSKNGTWTDFLTALFTATSATCVTGLVRVDTATYWSTFGQMIILLLIQIGGLGFMSMATLFSFLMRRTITLRERMVMTTSLNVNDMAGVVRLTRRVLCGTLLFESVGAVVLSIRWIPRFGLCRGIYKGVFHAISAFCNAGFDLMGDIAPFSSMSAYALDPVVNLTLVLLIGIGGLGFYVWNDIYENRTMHHLRLHTKLVLLTTGVLLIGGAVLIAFCEWENDATLGQMPIPARFMAAVFQSTTLRTAGFNTIDQGAMTGAGQAVSILLMFIGGSPGSTAGGIKTVTVAVLFLTAVTALRGKSHIAVFGREISPRSVMNAVTMLMVGFTLVIAGAVILSSCNALPFSDCLYEAVSAFGTSGVTTGITQLLDPISQVTLIVLMFLGRVGVLTLGVAVLMRHQREPKIRYPDAQLFVG